MVENTWREKLIRTLTSGLPVDPARKGRCLNCGACCMMPLRCPFLRWRAGENGRRLSRCLVYPLRPLNCRKYPRTAREQICLPCGFSFPSLK